VGSGSSTSGAGASVGVAAGAQAARTMLATISKLIIKKIFFIFVFSSREIGLH
jgi:hypothetical protein